MQSGYLHGTLVERTGPVSYKVQVSDQVWCHHALEHSVSSQSESVPETEMLLPDEFTTDLTE